MEPVLVHSKVSKASESFTVPVTMAVTIIFRPFCRLMMKLQLESRNAYR